MILANGGLPAHRYTPQVTQRWPRGSEPASPMGSRNIAHRFYVMDTEAFHFVLGTDFFV